ncbi:16S rRNA (cytidine(1402)-2'-O)-methyltransferase [Paenisporosarcina cavernae]|uniref:Ribosomal RNA small subunit methyltransferase I n=1 Tax=Paenisporosarcina cavernae TaxID=2320858 RepID=A0A385YWM4_9BACL|nr:16S rRNA (cytidine(1402)-2'-O)-methyltransferase [Paenisporosarcina cavernae]AYC30861.1 16S rRNA (cytidine(1402)-2'-O)-methyltransferase [Paenisporosarcina cavernae]
MQSQKSFEKGLSSGILYLIPTPIGNLEDMTFRAIRLMKEVSLIAAEDTRNTKKLCNHFGIDTPLTSYHDHNKEIAGAKLIDHLQQGLDVAIVSDAGLPCISDPGAEIVREAVAAGFTVVPIPGANAALTALIASTLPTESFTFYGFLPRNKKERRKELERIYFHDATLLFYEAPHRLKETLKDVLDVLGPNRKITLARELTKKFEEFLRGTVEEAFDWASSEEIRGEFVMVIEGSHEMEARVEPWEMLSVKEHIEYIMKEQEVSSKEAIKEVSKARNIPKREVYEAFHISE